MTCHTASTRILCAVLIVLAPSPEAARFKRHNKTDGTVQTAFRAGFPEEPSDDYKGIDDGYDIDSGYDMDSDSTDFTQRAPPGSLIATNASRCDISQYNSGGRFTNVEQAGVGKNGCVVLANDAKHGGSQVAVKVSYEGSVETECERAQLLHKNACTLLQTGKGEEALKLSERYLPTCLEARGQFLVMHAAKSENFGRNKIKLQKWIRKLSADERASIFAQTIGAVTAMHGVGFTHNDLHLENTVFLKNTHTVVLIDFGSTRPMAQTRMSGNHWDNGSDSTFPARMAAELTNCKKKPKRGDWDDSVRFKALREALLGCLQKEFGADDEFLDVFGRVMDEARAHKIPTLLPALYHTAWIQTHQPPLESLYSMGQCLK